MLGLFDLNTYFLNNPNEITAKLSLTLHRKAESTENKYIVCQKKTTNVPKYITERNF